MPTWLCRLDAVTPSSLLEKSSVYRSSLTQAILARACQLALMLW